MNLKHIAILKLVLQLENSYGSYEILGGYFLVYYKSSIDQERIEKTNKI